jgi:predicted helicase
VNGKPALEWIMERYQFTRDKDSQITNDPNDWSDDPQYIINLVKRIVRVIPGKGNRNDYNNRYRET